jgi:hypothetical protein
MTVSIIYYTGEKITIKNITALDFEGETGELHVQGDNGKVVKERLVKEVHVV